MAKVEENENQKTVEELQEALVKAEEEKEKAVKEVVEKALEQAQKEKDEAVEKALNEAKEVNKAETKKVIASEKENLVTVEIKKDREHREDVLVCVNGKNFQIKRGEKVEVPEYVCEVLENMKKMDELAIERMEKATKNFA